MDLHGRTVALFGDFDSIGEADAVRRLELLGARVVSAYSDDAELMFLAAGEGGPVPRTENMLRIPMFDEEALLGMLERGECAASSEDAEAPPLFLPEVLPAAAVAGMGADGVEALSAALESADWSAFVPDRDLVPLRTRLAELERSHGVTDAHRLATRRLRDTGMATLSHPYGHRSEIVGHALSPDGRYLATGSWYPDADYDEGGVLQIWDVASGRCVNTIADIEGGVGWPDYERTIQWSADSSRLAVAHAMSIVGVWSPTAADSAPVATIGVSDGNPRPSPFAFSPDGRSVYYHSTTNGDGGLQGCVVPLDRGGLFWLPNRVMTDHPYGMARRLPPGVREAFAKAEVRDGVGQWIEDPVWSPDGSRLLGSNAICVETESRTVVWHHPASLAAAGPDGRRVAVVADDGLSFLDAATGRPLGDPLDLGKVCGLRWAAGRPDRLAVLTPASEASGPAVHVFDDGRHVGSAAIPHPQWQGQERWSGDRDAWAWAPDGDRAASLTDAGTVEVWSFADPARAERVRSFHAEGANAVCWGAGDTLVLVADRYIRFVRADTGAVTGDFVSLREPDEPRPVEGEHEDEFERATFALDDDTWAMLLPPDVVVAPPGHEQTLDAVLTWAVGRRHSWPVRWGELRVLPDALAAADAVDACIRSRAADGSGG